jgi:hypothetical protein
VVMGSSGDDGATVDGQAQHSAHTSRKLEHCRHNAGNSAPAPVFALL